MGYKEMSKIPEFLERNSRNDGTWPKDGKFRGEIRGGEIANLERVDSDFTRLTKLEAELSNSISPLATIARDILALTYSDMLTMAKGLSQRLGGDATPADTAEVLHAWADSFLNPPQVEGSIKRRL